MVKVRFAPSPTGDLHVGNAKTALINFLFARSQAGSFVLRIEDTDIERSDAVYTDSIIDDLRWLGIEWDEGPVRQTERFELYRSFAEGLLRQGGAYKCFCSQDELEATRQDALRKGEPPRYSGKCRQLSESDSARLEQEGKPYVIRFRAPSRPIGFKDLIHGDIQFPRNHVDDFILMKQGLTPSYNFAVTIDDMDMSITHVIRGSDHISNTPKQMMLFQALGKTPPAYAHHSLLIGSDKKPLSKRHGVTGVKDFREMGIIAEALVNYLGILGRNVRSEIMNFPEMTQTFSLDSLSRADSFFDMEKLYWFNKEYMRTLPLGLLLGRLGLPEVYAERLGVLRENATTLKEMQDYLTIFESPELSNEDRLFLQNTGVSTELAGKLGILVTTDNASFQYITDTMIEISELKKRDCFMVLRLFITGRRSGPPLKEIFPLIPKEIILKRIENYLIPRSGPEA